MNERLSPFARTILLVGGALSLALLTGMHLFRLGEFQWSGNLVFLLIFAAGLEVGSSRLTSGATGSILFVAVSAVAMLYGGLPSMLVAAIAAAIGGFALRKEPKRIVFNAAQQAVSAAVAWEIYRGLGGSWLPVYASPTTAPSLELLRDVSLFFVMTTANLTVNSIFVATAIAFSSGQRFSHVWSRNNRGVAALDLGSTSISLLLVASFLFSQERFGSGVPGILLVAVPVLVSRKSNMLFRELQSSTEEMLQLMVKAIEARDPYTSGHSLRVQRLSLAIAGDLGVGGVELDQVATAAVLHDVGKIHEEFAPVLRKEGRLTESERALIETHAERGAALVGVIKRFRGAIEDAVRHHHERWDGEGYPSRLAGQQIPRISRIILIADTIDAMTTDRPYRGRLPLEAVVAELRRCAGKQFDPDMVEVAISSLAVRRIISEGDSRPASTIAERSAEADVGVVAVAPLA